MAETGEFMSLVDKKDRSQKKSKHEKGEHKSKKRSRDLDATESGERKHKKSRSHAAPEESSTPVQTSKEATETPVTEDPVNGETSKKEKRKRPRHAKKDEHQAAPTQQAAEIAMVPEDKTQKILKKDKHVKPEQEDATMHGIPSSQPDRGTTREKKEKKSKKHKRKHGSPEVDNAVPNTGMVADAGMREQENVESMDIDPLPIRSSESGTIGSKPSNQQYPFFTQTVSQYLPLYPSGLIEPLDGYADQHLKPLLKRYVPDFRGVLLAYRNPRVGEAPGKGSLTETSQMDDVVVLESVDEYAVSFSWLTVEVDLFRPTRGAWLEGTVNLQGEGHVGVVCWDMFNASIEAKRLPRGWRWVDLLSKGKDKSKEREKTPAEAKLPTPEPVDEAEDDSTDQLHTTGYWVGADGTTIRGGAKVQFRIKNYEVGVSGDYGYLSIEGTMLSEQDEKQKFADEMEQMRRRKSKHGGVQRKEHKRLPEFSMTKLGRDEVEEDEAQRTTVWKSSRPDSESE